MQIDTEKNDDITDRVCQLVGARASNLFLARQLWCSGAVLLALNEGLGGDLTRDQAIRLAAGLGDGLGGSGCLCGGLNAAAMALGLFLGQGEVAQPSNHTVLEASHRLHSQFKASFGATCCRILSKGLDSGSKAHFKQGAQHTAAAASLAAKLILEHKPELMQQVDWSYLHQKESRIGTYMKVVANRLSK